MDYICDRGQAVIYIVGYDLIHAAIRYESKKINETSEVRTTTNTGMKLTVNPNKKTTTFSNSNPAQLLL